MMQWTTTGRIYRCWLAWASLLFCNVSVVWGQNLIPNPGFETITTCPTDFRGSQSFPPWTTNSNTAYFWHTCFLSQGKNNEIINLQRGQHGPHTGKGFASVVAGVDAVTNEASYISAPLLQPLLAQQPYYVAVYADAASWAYTGGEHRLGIAFTETSLFTGVPSRQPIPFQPQVVFKTELNDNRPSYRLLSGCYVAKGGERLLTMGRFADQTKTLSFFLFLDDFTLSAMKFNLGRDTSFCQGTPYKLSATRPYAKSYRWQDGSTDSTYRVTQSGRYWCTLTTDCGALSDTITIDVRDPALELGADTSVCQGKPIVLSAGPGYDRYRWQDGSTAAAFTVNKPGVYSVEVERFNCLVRDSVNVLPSGECCELYVPTAFSPNADGVNDAFVVVTGCSDVVREPELLIYNRWGEVIFRTPDLIMGWNGYVQGVACSVGEYTWQLRYALPRRRALVRQQQRGTVLLTR